MVVRQTWRTKSPTFHFLYVFFGLVCQKNLMDVPSYLFFVHQKSQSDRPKTHLMARPSHVILKTNALQWRGRSFIDDIGWAAQWSVFEQISEWPRIFQSSNVSKSCLFHCVVEHHLCSCRGRRYPDDLDYIIWLYFPPSHVILAVYLVALMCGTVILISMAILHFWFEFSYSMAQAMQYSTWLVQLESYSFCLKL